jgi:hypothetical protein
MSTQIEVRLLYPNLGKVKGETVAMDAGDAELWCRRGLAEPLDAEGLAAAREAAQLRAARSIVAGMAFLPPLPANAPPKTARIPDPPPPPPPPVEAPEPEEPTRLVELRSIPVLPVNDSF